MPEQQFVRWLDALDTRYLGNLRFQEVTRALRALSSVYVERRSSLSDGAALDSTGKRVAFALFYGPLHYLVTREIVRALAADVPDGGIVDLGCGTGAAGAAWAMACGTRPRVLGLDRHPWAVSEACWTYRTLNVDGFAREADAGRARLPDRKAAILAAFTVNELPGPSRDTLLPRLLAAARRGSRVLIVEPIAKPPGGWWDRWADAVRAAGGREDTWRFEAALPERLRLLDRAAGLDHRVLTARSLWLRPTTNDPPSPDGRRRAGQRPETNDQRPMTSGHRPPTTDQRPPTTDQRPTTTTTPCVIFDMDGVLVDSYHAHFESWRAVAAEEGVTLTEAEFARSFGRTSREIIRATWPVPDIDEAAIAAIDTRKEAAFRRIVSDDFPLMDGARDLIAALRAAGFRLAVGSSAPPENIALALDTLGSQQFDGVVNGMDVKRGKPDPEVFLLAASRTGVEPGACVVIEDARYGVEAAIRAGMASVAFVSTGRHEDDFRGLEPDLMIRSLRELSPAILTGLIARHRA